MAQFAETGTQDSAGAGPSASPRLSRPEARRDLRRGSLEGYAPVPTLAAGDIVITRGGRSTLTGQPTMPITRGFAFSCFPAGLLFGQAAPQKHLTARELFYAAAQAPASQTGNARPPAKRSTRTPAKPVEIPRADPHSPATRSAEPPPGVREYALRRHHHRRLQHRRRRLVQPHPAGRDRPARDRAM